MYDVIPTREIYWNISGIVWMYILLLLALIPFCWQIYQRLRLWRLCQPEVRWDNPGFVYREMYADIEKTNGAPTAPRTVEDMLAYPKLHPHVFRWAKQPFDTMLVTYFHDERLKLFLKRLAGYLTDDPTLLTVPKMAPMFGYYFDGGYYPVGGSQVIADALARVIEENGGKVYLRTQVKRIPIEGKRAVGVVGNGAVHCAEAIISNADARKTFLELVGREYLPAPLAE